METVQWWCAVSLSRFVQHALISNPVRSCQVFFPDTNESREFPVSSVAHLIPVDGKNSAGWFPYEPTPDDRATFANYMKTAGVLTLGIPDPMTPFPG